MTPPSRPSFPMAIAGAALLTLLSCGLQWLLWPYLPTALWLLFYPTVYISSWKGGWPAGATATVLSVILVWLIFIPARVPLHGGLMATGVFVFMSTVFCIGHERSRRAASHLQILFAQSADALIVAGLDGRCRSVNQAACDLLGYTRAQLLGLSFFDLVPPEDEARMRRALATIRQGKVDRLELSLRHQKGAVIPVELSTNALPQDACLISIRDISPRRAADESLLQMRAELYEAQRLGKIGSWKWNRLTNEATWSPELYRIYQLDPSKPPPPVSELEQMYSPESRQARHIALAEAFLTGAPYEAERELILQDGQRLWLYITAEGVRDAHGVINELRGTAQDITERTRVELALIESRKELRDMAAHREQERERERKAIAQEIHDELGQLLAAMRMDVSQLRKHCPDVSTAKPALDDLNRLVERTFEVVRSLATSLRPSALDMGLGIALEWLVEDFSVRWEIPCEFALHGEECTLDDMRATAIFRVVQESLTNIAKHAQATQVQVTLQFDPDEVSVSVQDNGLGFEPAKVSRRGHFGLLGMRERVLALHGQIELDSAPGEGTRIAIHVPIAAEFAQVSQTARVRSA